MASKFLKIPRPMTSNTYSYLQKNCYAILQNIDCTLFRTASANKISRSTKSRFSTAPEFESDGVLEDKSEKDSQSNLSSLKRLRSQLYEFDIRDLHKSNKLKSMETTKRADDIANFRKTPKKLPKLIPCISDCPERETYTPTYTPKLKRLKPVYDDSQMKWRHKNYQKLEFRPERMDDIRGYKPLRKKLPAYLKSPNTKKKMSCE